MILLIDADSIIYTVTHNKKEEPIKTLDDCIKGANNFLNSLCNQANADEAHLFLTIGRCFRYDIYPGYKGNRHQDKPAFFYEVRDYLIKEYKAIFMTFMEADDLLNIYKNKYIESRTPYYIYSKDKDVKNLFGAHLNVENNSIHLVDTEYASTYFWKSMIIGDSADNIKGVPKKGEKFVEEMFSKLVGESDKYPMYVLNEYIKYFGEMKGIEEYYKNYKCLLILDSYEDMEFQEPIKTKDIYARTLSVVE